MRTIPPLTIVFLMTLVGCSSSDDSAESSDDIKVGKSCPVPAACTFQGKELLEGESATDGCNTCICGKAGLACTKQACPRPR